MPLYDASSMEIQVTRIHGTASADTFFEEYQTLKEKAIKQPKKVEKK